MTKKLTKKEKQIIKEGNQFIRVFSRKSKKLKNPVYEYGRKRTKRLKKKSKKGRSQDRKLKSKEAHEKAYWGF